VRLNFKEGEARNHQLQVIAPDGHEIVSQVEIKEKHNDGSIKSADLLFQATIVPGERPEYRLLTRDASQGRAPTKTDLVARRLGVGRFEMANDRFGVIVNLGFENTEPALVAAFNKTAGEHRMLNLVDTSPDVNESLAYGKKSAGFGTFLTAKSQLQRTGAFDQIEIIESGPFRAHVKLSGANLGNFRETWEFVWYAGSPVLRWRSSLDKTEPASSYGFFFSSVSASPYEPFDRWIDGAETRFPDGWETDNPPDRKIGPQDFTDLPGRQLLYYQREENYGALGFYELDQSLEWNGIGARQFIVSTSMTDRRTTEIAIAFPRWKGTETVLEGRKEYRKFIQPMMSVVRAQGSGISNRISTLPAYNESFSVRSTAQLKSEMSEQILDIQFDGAWKLNFAEKSEGELQGFHRPDFNDSSWRTVQVPGTVHTQILPSPKFHTKEADWISAKEWWYRRGFAVPPTMNGKRLWLKFNATDYYADIYLNGELLGRHEGYIDPYHFDVTDRLKTEGENVLAVRVWTPVSYYWRHRPYTIKGSYGAVDQKPDNITALGITRSVHLIASGKVAIDEIAVDTRINKDGSADVVVDLSLDTKEELDAQLTLALIPRNFDSAAGLELKSQITISRRTKSIRFLLHVEKPELWWTWDHGRPNLYTLDIRVRANGALSDHRTIALGIREIEHIDWKFYLNGKRMFIRGTNSYYNLFLSEKRRRDYEHDIGLMRKMNINMIRLHCHFSNPEFYEICDEQGILIWQDYLEAWYPEDRAFSLRAARLYDPHINYVRNHPSVAVWATSDEESLENYRDLTKHLEPRLYINDPQRRPVVRSTGRYGDAHVYEGWYGGTIWEYTRVTEKFISELGATALPNYESIIKFLPNHWPIKDHEEEWVFHKLQITEAMRAWGDPGAMTLQEYIPQTQDYVARLFQLAIERMRRLKYRPAGGILHFHAIDIWPSVTMAALDFYRQPTKAYSTVQRSFQMVLPSFAYDRDTWASGEAVKTELWLINDHWFAIPNTSVSWRLENSEAKVISTGNAPGKITMEADSSMKLMDLNFSAGGPGKYSLWARVTDERGKVISENNYEFRVK
ncbi:MAG: beta galactosidase jelly roll domain-containing protein, partial [Acidobacteria bacterium]|nr:beta galactosidase jelly roll domain-containing protein [Acidobacteriota bacterium]